MHEYAAQALHSLSQLAALIESEHSVLTQEEVAQLSRACRYVSELLQKAHTQGVNGADVQQPSNPAAAVQLSEGRACKQAWSRHQPGSRSSRKAQLHEGDRVTDTRVT